MFKFLKKIPYQALFLFRTRVGKVEEKYLGDMNTVLAWATFYEEHKEKIQNIKDIASFKGIDTGNLLEEVFIRSVNRINAEKAKSKLASKRKDKMDSFLGKL